ncbi:MAG: C25 family cysteine peptidase, partial [Thermoflexales bacterium]|nr:C25 family cysteine peptidase [Thermoflexales bacterium]
MCRVSACVGLAAALGFTVFASTASARPQTALRVQAEAGTMEVEASLDKHELDQLPLRWPLSEAHALPFAAWLIALPNAQTLPSVEVHEMRTERVPTLALPALEGNSTPQPLPPGWPLHVEPAGVARSVALARVQLFPARPVADGWEVVRVLRASVRWRVVGQAHGQEQSAAASATEDDPLLDVLRAHVVNPVEVRAQPTPTPFSRASSTPIVALIDVAQPSLVAITRASLQAVGASIGSPHTLRLRQGGTEVRMMWEGDEDDAFEEGERLVFYALPRFSRYADHDTWVLEDAGSPVARVITRSAAPASLPLGALHTTIVFERNYIYTPDCGCRPPLHRDGDRWAWANLQQSQTWTQAFTLPIHSLRPVTITLWLIGYTDPPQDPDHRTQVWLNGTLLGEVTWNGRQAVTATFLGSASANNQLSVTLPGLAGVSAEGTWVDAFAVTFPTEGQGVLAQPMEGEPSARSYRLSFVPMYLLDVTAPNQPVKLTDWQSEGDGVRFADTAAPLPRRYAAFTEVAAPLRVRAPAALNPASGRLHIVAPQSFMEALAPLVARRAAQGFTVVTQSVQAIYDHYGDGRMDPNAIRSYFAARYHSDAVRPAYALLVGDGTLDPRRHRATTPPTQIPPFLAEVDPFLGETAADNRFVTVDGDDALPDIALGRLPVNTVTETQRLVHKILAHESALLTPADRQVLLVADNADAGGNFPQMANALAAQVHNSYHVVSALMTSSNLLTETRQTLFAHWNRARLTIYFGHASPRQWAVERIFHRDEVPTLPARE